MWKYETFNSHNIIKIKVVDLSREVKIAVRRKEEK